MTNNNSVKITGMIVGAVIVLALIGVFSQSASMDNTVSAQGIADIEVMPDLVTVNFNVETDGETAVEAKNANSEIVDDLIVGVLKLGFERKDIQTSNFNVYPEYTWENNRQKENGYKAVHYIQVEMAVEDSDKIGEVIDAGVDAGALISYINFELTQESQNNYKAEALRLASEDAKLKAEATAGGLDKSLGKLVSVSTSDFDYYPWRLYDNSAGGVAMDSSEQIAIAKEAATNIQPGEQTVSARVSVVYKIK